jgi:hypothetical protein
VYAHFGEVARVLLRILRGILVGMGLAFFTTILLLVGLWAYLKFWVFAHPGIGAVAGGVGHWAFWILLVVFAAGFGWEWRRARRK